jgi:uncharacterized membrane protein
MQASPPPSNFRKFFVRGLGILLPSVLTIWILIAAYGFVQNRIAEPINSGVRRLVVTVTPWPGVLEGEMIAAQAALTPAQVQAMSAARNPRGWLHDHTQAVKLENWWSKYSFPLDFIGLIIAVFLIYFVGLAVGSFIGRRLYHRGETLLQSLPLIKQVYPSVKQVTDFFVGDNTARLKFNRVVAVEYPRKGIWSVGLVTSDAMSFVQQRAGRPCLTIFVPSSPTPFTGYVITAPVDDTIDLPVTIEEALRMVMSGGVVIPASQRSGSATAVTDGLEASSSSPAPQETTV